MTFQRLDCLDPKVKNTQLGPIDRARKYNNGFFHNLNLVKRDVSETEIKINFGDRD
jgi:hypothetical protein